MKKHDNILIISGDGRKSGKTTLACLLISALESQGVIAVKICPHFHDIKSMEVIMEVSGLYGIYRETLITCDKDSSLMLAAGAAYVYYIQCSDSGLKAAWEEIEKILPDDRPVICESGGLAGIINPGLHVLMKGSAQKKTVVNKADVEITIDKMPDAADNFSFSEGKWNWKK